MNYTNFRSTNYMAVRCTFSVHIQVLRLVTTGLAFFLFTCNILAQDAMYNNGKIRIGNGAENSINAKGNMQQPFYHNGSNWIKLTYSNIALNATYAIGGDGINEWNINGELKNDPMLTGHNLDLTNFNEGSGIIVSSGMISFSGTNLTVETTYHLLPEVNFMKISVRLTNPGTDTIQNVRMWIGTRDDYVGITDNPVKQRGNLVDDQFEPLTEANKRGAAIQIISGQEGVFLYADSDKSHSILQNCCNWNNVVNQDPNTASIASGSDGSYGLYFRFADLGPGESDFLDWYYGAGAIDEFEDIIQSVALAASPMSDISCTTATYRVHAQTSGTGHYIVVPKSADPPTAPQIKMGENYGNVGVISSGSAILWAGTPFDFHLENLESAGEYTVYFILEEQDNVFSAFKFYSFTTLASIVIDLESLSTTFCGSEGNGSIHSHITGGEAPYTYLWSSGDTTEHISGKPAGEYTILVNDAGGCPPTTALTTIEVNDMNPPVALTQPVLLYYDSTGTASLSPGQVNNGSYDDCGIDIMEISHTEFHCHPQSAAYHTAILSVFDLNGNMDEAVALVEVIDTIRPHALAQNRDIYIDANGLATATAETVDIGSTDNCTLEGKQLSQSLFDCTHLGENVVNYTLTDSYGNSSFVEVILTIVDTIKPSALAQDLEIELDDSGVALATAAMADAGSFDNCGITEVELSKTNFDCSDLGKNTIWFTVKDISGNETTKLITVSVLDRSIPLIESPVEITICEGMFNMNLSVSANDNCGAKVQQISGPIWGDSLVPGNFEINFQATDFSGNTTTKTTWIHVVAQPETTLQNSYEVGPGEYLQLMNPENPNLKYLWSTGDTTPTLSVHTWEETAIWVRVENDFGCVLYHEILIKIRDPFEISNPQKGGFLLYPNPAFNNMNVRFDLPEKMQNLNLQITDAQGRIIKSQNLLEIDKKDVVAIDIGNLSQGLYHVSLQASGFNYSSPFVKF